MSGNALPDTGVWVTILVTAAADLVAGWFVITGVDAVEVADRVLATGAGTAVIEVLRRVASAPRGVAVECLDCLATPLRGVDPSVADTEGLAASELSAPAIPNACGPANPSPSRNAPALTRNPHLTTDMNPPGCAPFGALSRKTIRAPLPRRSKLA